jgi:CDP-6-deoxy-D-xylo-4-hexulose-3-dehydrase
MMNENPLLNDIHGRIADYAREHMDFRFNPSAPVVRLHEPSFGAQEVNVALDVLLSTRVTMGPKVKQFEREYAAAFGFGHGVMVNSGSSANLLAIAAVANPAWKDGLRPGDEVIVPALSWSTTVWPLIQMGLVPVIVDCDPATFNLDPQAVERAIGPKTRGLLIVPVYGNPCDMDALTDICRRHNLLLMEDCCEAMGASYDGRAVGRFGLFGTFSTYYSHHITTLEGGLVMTDHFDFAELMRILRAHGWTRELENRQPWLDQHPGFDPKFLFVNLGYNLRATEVQGAMGSVQLPKLAGFIETRRANAAAWRKDLARWGAFFDMQQDTPKGINTCFGFALTLKDDAPFTVADMTAHLNRASIETRPIICGNIALQPAMQMFPHRVSGDLKHSTRIMRQGFSFGNHHHVCPQARQYVTDAIASFMQSRGLKG